MVRVAGTKMTIKWTTELTVGFVPLPPEKEEAYWAAIRYFARVMFLTKWKSNRNI
jgi:hypothetical protein